jgi:hypothetical protein
MAQIFHPAMNTFAKASIFGAVFIIAFIAWVGAGVTRSSYVTDEGIAKNQPVPFSHEHHVSGLGIDCRYCHTSVDKSAFAGIPATKTCMTCHSQIWTNAAMLQPVRDSWLSGQPIRWTRVNDLPDYVYFNHSIHIAKGVGCNTCHGPVDQMPLMYQAKSLQMEWCLDCHKNPEKYVRPKDQVFNMKYQPPSDQQTLGETLVNTQYHVHKEQLTNCAVCHR